MLKLIKILGYGSLLLIIGFFSIFNNTSNSTSNELGTLIEYKDSFLANDGSLINELANIVNKTINENENIIDNRGNEIVLNTSNNILQGPSISNSNNSNASYFQANQNAPKNPTIYSPITGIGNSIKVNYGVPLFFISYFEDGNLNQEGGYTVFKIVDKNSGDLVNRMFLGQAKYGDTYQIPALNKTYTYGFYQTQDISNLFLAGGNLNLTSNGITNLNTAINLPVGDYNVFIQNINKYGLKSDNILAGNLEILVSNGLLGSVTSIGPDGATITNLSQLNFNTLTGIKIHGLVGSATKIEFINNTKNDDIYASDIVGNDFTLSGLDFVEGTNLVNINFYDDSNKIINTIPLLINIDTSAPEIFNAGINIKDYAFDNITLDYKKTFDLEKNIITFNNLINVNDNLSSNGIENLNAGVPFYLEYNDSNINGVKFYYGYNNNYTSITNLVNPSLTGDVNGRKFIKFNTNEDLNVDKDKRIYLYGVDSYGNKSPIIAIDFYLNRKVNDPIIVTNNGESFAIKDDTVDLMLSIDSDVNQIIINGVTYVVPYGNSITLYGLQIYDGENNFSFIARDFMGNQSNVVNFNVIKEQTTSEGLNGTDLQLKINGTINAGGINFNRITPNGDAGEVIQGN